MATTIRGETDILLGKAIGVNINNAGSDNSVTIPYAKYIVRRVIITNPSTSLAASTATIGVFTGAGGTGTTVVAAATMTTLTGSTKFSDRTLALTTDTLAAAILFVRNVIAHGSAATVDVYIFGDALT